MVPAVTELLIAEFMYLQWVDDTAPIYLYINSTGTMRDDNEVVCILLLSSWSLTNLSSHHLNIQ